MLATQVIVDGAASRKAPFSGLRVQPPDPLLSLIKGFEADSRAAKIDLGVGVYRDAAGATPVLRAVKSAEALLQRTQASKAYLGPEGDVAFLAPIQRLAFGEASTRKTVSVQTPGGTGALRLAAELIQLAKPGARIWIGTPTWPNHAPIFTHAGLQVAEYRHSAPLTQSLCFDEMIATLSAAASGDVVLLHGCCHNPTGIDPTEAQWRTIANVIASRGLIPLIDLAYQGLGVSLDSDAASLRLLLRECDTVLVAYSCDKNFGLYRDRVGALFIATDRDADIIQSNVLALARAAWSMPPDHGAAVVRAIFDHPDIFADWRKELDAMCARLRDVRMTLAALVPALKFVAMQHGLFALLPLSASAVEALRLEHGIYMAGSGRINLAGLNNQNLPAFAAALNAQLQGDRP
jgi:aromatic-amino-acid transaminase